MSNQEIVRSMIKTRKELGKKLDDIMKESGEQILVDIFTGIFQDNPGLKRFAFVGQTPSFNDGEPCVHSSSVFVGKKKQYNNYAWFNEMDYSTLEEFFEIENDSSINRECETLERVYEELEGIVELLDIKWETNFMVLVSIDESGVVSVEHQDYYPDY